MHASLTHKFDLAQAESMQPNPGERYLADARAVCLALAQLWRKAKTTSCAQSPYALMVGLLAKLQRY